MQIITIAFNIWLHVFPSYAFFDGSLSYQCHVMRELQRRFQFSKRMDANVNSTMKACWQMSQNNTSDWMLA